MFAQVKNDTITHKADPNKTVHFNYKQLILPAALVSYGVIGQGNNAIKDFNFTIRRQVLTNNVKENRIDDYIQFLPMATTLGLSGIGVQGKHNFKDKTIIAGTATVIMLAIVNATKYTVREERPDISAKNSFPSGHTANAFLGAELLYQEYKDVSVWYGVSGYVVAATTGVMRVSNNRHWLTDIVAGAGIGILSTKAAYWLYPTVSKLFNAKNKDTKTGFIPYYDGRNAGFGLVSSF